jgi:NAD(P)-dependent dehydrogenase (short-subunit alcohol dehydrogenase family)
VSMIGKVALVTGGASGIGAASCARFAAAGAKVVVVDIDRQAGEAVAERLCHAGHTAIFVAADVSKEKEVAGSVEATLKAFGQLDYAHNNAGIDQFHRKNVVEMDEEDWDRIIRVNLKSVYLGMKHEIPAMLRQGGGAIVNTSSGAGIKGVPLMPAYVASKFAIVGLTKSTAIDFARQNIRINVICPGLVDTPLVSTFRAAHHVAADNTKSNPMQRIGRAEEIANGVVWLCSDEASYATGTVMSVDGGFSAN